MKQTTARMQEIVPLKGLKLCHCMYVTNTNQICLWSVPFTDIKTQIKANNCFEMTVACEKPKLSAGGSVEN